MKAKIIQVTPRLKEGDSITNCIFFMRDIVAKKGKDDIILQIKGKVFSESRITVFEAMNY